MYMCTLNTELIQIKAEDFLNLILNSNKGVDYVYNSIIDFIMEL